MPRLWVISDLHREVDPERKRSLVPPDFDILVVAGDVFESDPKACVEEVARLADGRPAIMVLGNHDLYGLPIERAALVARALGQPRNVFVLERSAVEIGGLRFAGGTLWEDLLPAAASGGRPDLTSVMAAGPAVTSVRPEALYSEPVQVEDENGMRPATCADIARRHDLTVAAIRAAEADIVVTHYPPTDAALAAAGDRARLWIHGHLHAFDRRHVGNLEVVVNAAQSRIFADRLVIDIPEPAEVPTRGC